MIEELKNLTRARAFVSRVVPDLTIENLKKVTRASAFVSPGAPGAPVAPVFHA